MLPTANNPHKTKYTLYDVSYNNAGTVIRLPVYILKDDANDDLLSEDFFYKFFPLASIFLCKPFEYINQSFFFPGSGMPDNAFKAYSSDGPASEYCYVHVGEELNGLWPFLCFDGEDFPKDDPRVRRPK